LGYYRGKGPLVFDDTVALQKVRRVIAIDFEDYRLELSEKYGAVVILNAKKRSCKNSSQGN
jgi:threonine dehydrogenase-like Zn-dependent dehydrogenase